jgi:hypothetical protein
MSANTSHRSLLKIKFAEKFARRAVGSPTGHFGGTTATRKKT